MKALLSLLLIGSLLAPTVYAGTNVERYAVPDARDDFCGIYINQSDRVVLEAHDTDGDGQLDAFLTLDENGEVKDVSGAGARVFVRPPVVEFAELVVEQGGSETVASGEEADLVGSLDSITIPRYHNYMLYLGLLILAGGGFWYYKKRKRGANT